MVLLFKGIAPLSQFPATAAIGAPPRPGHACFEDRVDVCFETLWRRGGRGLQHAHYVFKTNSLCTLGAHNMRTHYAHTLVAHRVHKCAACPSWGSPRWGLKTLVIGVVELREAMNVGRNATSPLHSRGSPTKETKSEVAASPLPSRRPKSGRKCYIIPAFSGVPNKGDKSKVQKKKEKRKKRFPLCSSSCLGQLPALGNGPRTFQLQRHYLPTRVRARSNKCVGWY